MADASTESLAPANTASTEAAPPVAPESQTAVASETGKPAETAAPAATTEAKPAEGDAAAQAAKAAEPAKPVEYEFKAPEGVTLNPEALDELKAFALEKGLTQEEAQKLADMGIKQAQQFSSALAEQQKTATAEWENATKTDKEIGGDKLPENLAVAKKALDAFGSPELKTLLSKSGLGNHPEIVRMFVKAGRAISEDGRLVTGAAAQDDRANQPLADRIYGKPK